MDNLQKAIIEELHIKPRGFFVGLVLFFFNLIPLIFIPNPPFILKIDMLLIIGGILLLRLRPRWR